MIDLWFGACSILARGGTLLEVLDCSVWLNYLHSYCTALAACLSTPICLECCALCGRGLAWHEVMPTAQRSAAGSLVGLPTMGEYVPQMQTPYLLCRSVC
jgi:hypothetical protein